MVTVLLNLVCLQYYHIQSGDIIITPSRGGATYLTGRVPDSENQGGGGERDYPQISPYNMYLVLLVFKGRFKSC